MKNVGIWLDTRKAVIVTLTPNVNLEVLRSNIEENRPKGGSRSKSPNGPVITIKEKGFLEKRKHQSNAFFKDIVDRIKESDNLYIMGPSQSKNELNDYLMKQHTFSPNIIKLDPADSMTDNQIIAQVKQIFKDHLS